MSRKPSERDADERASLLRLAHSFLMKRVLASRSTPHNPVLEVVYANGRCILNAENVNYSFGALHRVFEDAFAELHLERRRLRDVLLLGCGAGSVVQILRGKYSKDCTITAVEIDPVVIELARQYFLLDRVTGLEVVCTDAGEYVRTASRKFDLVVIDLFIDDRVPAQCRARAFLRSVRDVLQPGGLLVFNAIDDTQETEREAQELEDNVRAEFPGFGRLGLSGNRIYHASAAHESSSSAVDD